MVARTVCESTGFVRSLIIDLDGVTGEVRGRAGYGVDAGIVASVHGAREEFPVIDGVATRDSALVLGPDELRAVVPTGYVERFEVDGLVVVQAMRSDRLGLLGVVFCDVGVSSTSRPPTTSGSSASSRPSPRWPSSTISSCGDRWPCKTSATARGSRPSCTTA